MVLHLTTPLMGSRNKTVAQHVTALQKLLIKHGYLVDTLDGEYGVMTAQAVYKAKYHLGYLHPDQTSGDLLYAYLLGSKSTTPTMKLLAKKRQLVAARKAASKPIPLKALDILIAKTGMKESPPDSNRCEISQWYGIIGPWCAMTGVYAYHHAGSKVFTLENAHKHNWAYVPNIYNDARAGRYGLTLTKAPKPGDGICFDWPGESPGLPDHYGTFEKWIDFGKTFYTREGNTGVGNDSNGGELMQRQRDISMVMGFVVIHG